MGSPDLKLDLQLLAQLRDDLDAVVREFENADDISDDVAEATGDDELQDRVHDFAHKWNDKRKKMTESVKALRESIGAITDGFTKVDAELAKALEDAAAEVAKNNPEAKPE